MPGAPIFDANEHLSPTPGTALTAGAVSTTAAGTISPTTAAGNAPTITFPTGFRSNDTAGTFEINPVTSGGAQAAGVIAKVRFLKPYGRIPTAVMVHMEPITDPDDAVIVCATAVTAAGFDVLANSVLTTAETYRVYYHVIP